jgi:hypothetical protein
MDVEVAIPCGLTVNELVTNALERAFSTRRVGGLLEQACKQGCSWRIDIPMPEENRRHG